MYIQHRPIPQQVHAASKNIPGRVHFRSIYLSNEDATFHGKSSDIYKSKYVITSINRIHRERVPG